MGSRIVTSRVSSVCSVYRVIQDRVIQNTEYRKLLDRTRKLSPSWVK